MSATILIVDDAASIRHILKLKLEKIDEIDTVLLAADGSEGLELLRENRVDLVLCDLIMPEIDGHEFLARKDGIESAANIPVIMLTGEAAVEDKVCALGAGASDYLTKPFDDAELIARVRVHLYNRLLQRELRVKNAELEILNQKLEELNRTDPLTGTANRRSLNESLEREYLRAQRYQRPLSLLMMDVDHFKHVNDTHGHQAGDTVLITIASSLLCSLRKQDVVGRYGGEEFAVVLPETVKDNALIVAERCRDMVASIETDTGSSRLKVTMSVGVAALSDEGVSGTAELIRAADRALYQAKREGRNRVVAA